MKFVDEVTIQVTSGKGGDGCSSFRREKFVPYGGPDGGNGGNGGHVIFKASQHKRSLLDFKFKPYYQAERGQHGKGKEMTGKAGEHLILEVPPGTQIYTLQPQELLIADLVQNSDEVIIAQGGRGGRGNKTFVSSTNRSPQECTPGEEGTVVDVKLVLKLMADIGLVGLPNAGKSSLLHTISRAKPKIADYPFTTLTPQLGVVSYHDSTFVIADLPGLIEGASDGVGLGHQFLKHTQRNNALLHIVDVSYSTEKVLKNISLIETELKRFSDSLTTKETVIVYNKTDLLTEEEIKTKRNNLPKGLWISTVNQNGLETLKARCLEISNKKKTLDTIEE